MSAEQMRDPDLLLGWSAALETERLSFYEYTEREEQVGRLDLPDPPRDEDLPVEEPEFDVA